MILDHITLENFGAYSGIQKADLAPRPGKPIVLFGGMNGGGKTTFLDSIQLGLYGSKAKTSNRGRKGYLDYLSQCIHRGADRSEGASITIAFRRMINGESRQFEVQRRWFESEGKIQEQVYINCDGQPDEILTEHWDETMASYMPSEIAHLFFFDGEQIKELAEGRNAAKIIGSAIHSLLGLDLVERLSTDLKVFEKRKREKGMDSESLQRIQRAESEVETLDHEIAELAQQEGRLVNEASRGAEAVRQAEEHFRNEGGELFLKREEIEHQLNETKAERADVEDGLRNLAKDVSPFSLLADELDAVEAQAQQENATRQARSIADVLESRDADLLKRLKQSSLPSEELKGISSYLEKDQAANRKKAEKNLIFDAADGLPAQIAHLKNNLLPSAKSETASLLSALEEVQERIGHLDTEIARTPDEDRIQAAQENLVTAQAEHAAKLKGLEDLRLQQERLQRQMELANRDLERVNEQAVDTRYEEDARQRSLKHSEKVRNTLDAFRVRVVKKHVQRIESLMLESFTTLLRKSKLITGLKIDPATFEVTLMGADGLDLPFDRLSAGERQLLATSFLWGLARASGRPVPTIIDTPLGRLDSSHRTHLTKQYFPAASHQVLLLSTDEEIVGPYMETLRPYISRSYLLHHDDKLGQTNIQEGYFAEYETAS